MRFINQQSVHSKNNISFEQENEFNQCKFLNLTTIKPVFSTTPPPPHIYLFLHMCSDTYTHQQYNIMLADIDFLLYHLIPVNATCAQQKYIDDATDFLVFPGSFEYYGLLYDFIMQNYSSHLLLNQSPDGT